MKKGIQVKNVLKLAGAYCAYLIGSGFASGQEIMQFYTGYGLKSLAAIAVSALLFIWVGVTITQIGYDHKQDKHFSPYSHICGNVLGKLYEAFSYIYLFCIVVVMISGAGASLNEYYHINHFIGSLIMAILVYISIAFGLQRLIDAIGCIGPIVVCFTIFISVVTLIHNVDGLRNASYYISQASIHTPSSSWIGGGALYAAYNLVCAIVFFSALGGHAKNRREASLGAALGGIMLIVTILTVNTAFLCCIKKVSILEIPTLYLAQEVSPIAGGIFLVILLCGIFSTAAPMAWTVCNRFIPEHSSKKKQLFITAIIIALSFIGGLFPFGKLIGIIYPISGYMGLIFFVCLAVLCVRKKFLKQQ